MSMLIFALVLLLCMMAGEAFLGPLGLIVGAVAAVLIVAAWLAVRSHFAQRGS